MAARWTSARLRQETADELRRVSTDLAPKRKRLSVNDTIKQLIAMYRDGAGRAAR